MVGAITVGVVGVGALVGTVVARALAAGRPSADSPDHRAAGSAERLSRMVRIPTVSLTSDDADPEPFEHFEALLAEEYPLVHSRLEREKITSLGILYRWRGLSEGFTPAHDVYVSLGGNEERFGTAAQRIAAEFSRRDIRPWLVLDEGGAIIGSPFPGIAVPLAMVGVAEKGVATICLQTRGDCGHASAPPAVTATTRLSRAVRRLEKSPFPVALSNPTRDMLASFAPISLLSYRLAYANMSLFARPIARMLAARGGETEAMTRTTVAVTMLEAGTAPNVLPAAARATLNVRIAIGETVDTVVTTLRATIGDPAVEIIVLEGSDPTPVPSSGNEQFALISQAVTASYPGTVTAPYVANAVTDSRHFHRFVPAVYRFSPFAMSAEQRASVHGVDERDDRQPRARGTVRPDPDSLASRAAGHRGIRVR